MATAENQQPGDLPVAYVGAWLETVAKASSHFLPTQFAPALEDAIRNTEQAARDAATAAEPDGEPDAASDLASSTDSTDAAAEQSAEPAADALEAFFAWLRQRTANHRAAGRTSEDDFPLVLELKRTLSLLIARIDKLLQDQVNAILHHPRFQQLESSWRGLQFLVGRQAAAIDEAQELGDNVKIEIQVLSVGKKELYHDLANALEFDQSTTWKKIYESGFGTAGATPFTALIGDYNFANTPSDIQTLESMSQVAAASFSPFISAAAPSLLGVETYEELQYQVNDRAFRRPDYVKWQQLRQHPDSRFLGMVVPKVLLRTPHDYRQQPLSGAIRFQEDVTGPNADKYLWGNGAFAFAGVLIRCFADSGWFSDIRGIEKGVDGGGLVTGLPTHEFFTDSSGMSVKSSLNVVIDDIREKEFSSLGLIPLCQTRDTELAVFFTNQSVHSPQAFDDELKTANERMSSMLQYVLCTSRFAHYLKTMARQFLGSLQGPAEVQQSLNGWIHQYVNPDEKADPEFKARFPLREAEILVSEPLDRPGQYEMSFRLLPHFQLDALAASVTLRTSIVTPE